MNRRLDDAETGKDGPLPRGFSVLFGAFLGLALFKFGNPPIMERWVTAPANIYEFLLGNPWPIRWAYVLLALLAAIGISVANWKVQSPNWLVALPVTWLIWQCVSAAATVSPALTKSTLLHFFACAACFYLGLYSLSGSGKLGLLWPGLFVGLLIVIALGWQQHFGGLEQTRRYFYLYLYPRMKEVPPEYLKKLSSTRVYSTLFYPNTLAGAMLLFLPPTVAVIWGAREKFTAGARAFLLAAVGTGGLGCLYWSGSKGGWLLMLALGLICLFRLPFSRRLKQALIVFVLVGGLGAFFWRYSGFFQKGATSVSARFDYWKAAVQTTAAHPLMGTGPGTFSIAYQKVKRPESEMARLAHNDYLQQGSDSGLPGLILYSAFIVCVMVRTAAGLFPADGQQRFSGSLANQRGPCAAGRSNHTNREAESTIREKTILFALYLGLLGWALQSFFEFGLYIPALAWPAFTFMGLLLGRLHRARSSKTDLSAG
jgi:O-antigen ligase